MTYLLDTNVFIQARRFHYGMDFCPAFWDWLGEANSAGKVFSIEKVSDEIAAGSDELADWAAERGEAFFLPPDQTMLEAMGKVSEWVNGQNFVPTAVRTFLQIADCYLVAHALSHGDTVVVTHEKPSTSIKIVKIPDVCIGLRIKCMSPFEMLRKERARFVLDVS